MVLQVAHAETQVSPSEEAADRLALQIAAGAYRPGDRLPSVRRLSEVLAINPSTVQVVLARLASLGFVEARRGVGFLVRDVERDGGIEVWSHIFRFAQQLPDRAAKIFADLLALRRTVVVDQVRAIAREPRRYRSDGVERAVERFALLVAHDEDPLALATAELAAFRELTLAVGNSAVTAVLNSVSLVYLSEPNAVRAMYSDPRLHVDLWRGLLEAWRGETLEERAAIELDGFLATFDAAVIARYRANLG
ncbi:MAG: GntR family transcriptional regulator [Sandaracinaceae bacterium]